MLRASNPWLNWLKAKWLNTGDKNTVIVGVSILHKAVAVFLYKRAHAEISCSAVCGP